MDRLGTWRSPVRLNGAGAGVGRGGRAGPCCLLLAGQVGMQRAKGARCEPVRVEDDVVVEVILRIEDLRGAPLGQAGLVRLRAVGVVEQVLVGVPVVDDGDDSHEERLVVTVTGAYAFTAPYPCSDDVRETGGADFVVLGLLHPKPK